MRAVFLILSALVHISVFSQGLQILEQGGISSEGVLGNNANRVRTVLLSPKGMLKVNPQYTIMNCMLYDKNGAFVGPETLHICRDGYVAWESDFQVRLSLCYSEDRNKVITPNEDIIIDYKTYVSDNKASKIPFLTPQWVEACSQRMSTEFQSTPVFRIPVMVVFKNGDVFIGCEAQYSESKHAFYAKAISKDGGKSFMAEKSEIPLGELVYDEHNDRLLSLTTSICYASDNHGISWYQLSTYSMQVKNGFDKNMVSPTTGIQLQNGILAVPMRCIRYKRDGADVKLSSIEKTVNFILFSRDYGNTWEQTCFTPESIIADEVVIVENKPNQIMLNSRGGTEYYWDATVFGRRVFIASIGNKYSSKKWNLKSWKLESKSDGKMWDPLCNASMTRIKIGSKKMALFCNPYMPDEYSPRRNLCLQVSNNFKKWSPVGILTPPDRRVFGYSALSYQKGHIYFCYEDCTKGIQFADITDYCNNIIKALKNYKTNKDI